jgi:hypothetical protein
LTSAALTYALAVLAACANAVSSVLQRTANKRVPQSENMSLRQIRSLLHQPVWFFGILAITAGFLLQATALGSGQLAVVEPVLVLELPFTLILASRLFRQRAPSGTSAVRGPAMAADHRPKPSATRSRASGSVSASWPPRDPSGQPPLPPRAAHLRRGLDVVERGTGHPLLVDQPGRRCHDPGPGPRSLGRQPWPALRVILHVFMIAAFWV